MLYVLTGNVQTGKTRWLQRLIGELEAAGITPYGVIAPGRWIEHRDSDAVMYEKTGIDNELLPQHELMPFARRTREVEADEAQRTCSQASKAQLGWAIDDGTLNRVNEHLAWVAQVTAEGVEPPKHGEERRKGLLVIDELGRLEILHGNGLTNGIALVERGATPTLPHALVIVREQLLDQAMARFSGASWNEMKAILPTDEARDELLALAKQPSRR